MTVPVEYLDLDALIDRSRRLGWLATAVFRDINGTPLEAAASHDIHRLVVDVAASDISLDQVALRLQRLLPSPERWLSGRRTPRHEAGRWPRSALAGIISPAA